MDLPLLSIRNLQVRRDGNPILTISALDIYPGEVLGVIGPNGAGKTTLMMALSGLLPYQSGEVRHQGQVVHPWQDLSFRRRLALVLQAPLLLHTSVEANIASGLRFRRLDPVEIQRRVEDWAQRLSISHLLTRSANKISGGEAQRISLGRAFVINPDLLLLDEPFSALDAPTRAQLLIDLKSLLASTKTTTLLITHDLDEAIALSDRLAVLMAGQLRQVGSPREVFSMPADLEIARFTGVETIFSGRVTNQQDGFALVDCDDLRVQGKSSVPPGSQVYVCLRPEDIRLAPLDPRLNNGTNRILGTICALIPQGAMVRVMIEGETPLVALISRTTAQENGLETGQQIQATFRPEDVHLIQI